RPRTARSALRGTDRHRAAASRARGARAARTSRRGGLAQSLPSHRSPRQRPHRAAPAHAPGCAPRDVSRRRAAARADRRRRGVGGGFGRRLRRAARAHGGVGRSASSPLGALQPDRQRHQVQPPRGDGDGAAAARRGPRALRGAGRVWRAAARGGREAVRSLRATRTRPERLWSRSGDRATGGRGPRRQPRRSRPARERMRVPVGDPSERIRRLSARQGRLRTPAFPASPRCPPPLHGEPPGPPSMKVTRSGPAPGAELCTIPPPPPPPPPQALLAEPLPPAPPRTEIVPPPVTLPEVASMQSEPPPPALATPPPYPPPRPPFPPSPPPPPASPGGGPSRMRPPGAPAPPPDPAAPVPPAQVLKRQPPALCPLEAPPPPQLFPPQKPLPFPAPAPPPPAPGAPSPPSPLAVMLPSETAPVALSPSPTSDAPPSTRQEPTLSVNPTASYAR